MDKKHMQIENLIDLVGLKNILDNFAKATGCAFVTVDYKGVPVTEYSGFTDFCQLIRKKDSKCTSLCYQCDAHGGLQAAITGKPYIYKCHMGLIDFAVPIMAKNNYLGAILAGQVTVNNEEMETISSILNQKSDWEYDEELVEARSRITEVPYEKVVATAYTLLEISNYIVEREYVNIVKKTLDRNHMKLLEEEKKSAELEKSLKEAELKALYYQINPHFLFNALNTICRLAYIEKAEQTEEIAYAFSDMMRYILKKNNSEYVTVKDEITHSKNYLKIQKIRLGNRLNYAIDVPEEHEDIKCPFMILQPLIENSVKYVVETKEEGGNVNIRSYRKGSDIIIEIEDDGDGISKEKINNLLSEKQEFDIKKDESIGIRNVNKRLMYAFGKEYGLEIISCSKANKGTIVKVKVKSDDKQ